MKKSDICLAIFEESPAAIMIADDEGRYVELNPAAETLLGVKRSEIIGKMVKDFVAPMRESEAVEKWNKFKDDGIQEGKFVISRPDGTDRIICYTAKSNFLPGLHLSIAVDIT